MTKRKLVEESPTLAETNPLAQGLVTVPPPLFSPGLTERQQIALAMKLSGENSGNDAFTTPRPSKINKLNKHGESPLQKAAIKGDLKQVKFLIKQGADVNTRDNAGWSPLHEAACNGYVEVCRVLLKHGANVNVHGLGNETPLHDAAAIGNAKIVSLLLAHGANRNAKNDNGKKPHEVTDNREIIELLTGHAPLPLDPLAKSPPTVHTPDGVNDDDKVEQDKSGIIETPTRPNLSIRLSGGHDRASRTVLMSETASCRRLLDQTPDKNTLTPNTTKLTDVREEEDHIETRDQPSDVKAEFGLCEEPEPCGTKTTGDDGDDGDGAVATLKDESITPKSTSDPKKEGGNDTKAEEDDEEEEENRDEECDGSFYRYRHLMPESGCSSSVTEKGPVTLYIARNKRPVKRAPLSESRSPPATRSRAGGKPVDTTEAEELRSLNAGRYLLKSAVVTPRKKWLHQQQVIRKRHMGDIYESQKRGVPDEPSPPLWIGKSMVFNKKYLLQSSVVGKLDEEVEHEHLQRVPPVMRELLGRTRKERQKMMCRHTADKERLLHQHEQSMLRARRQALMKHPSPSVCSLLLQQNNIEFSKKLQSVNYDINSDQLLLTMGEKVMKSFTKLSEELYSRHKNESDTLYSSQRFAWMNEIHRQSLYDMPILGNMDIWISRVKVEKLLPNIEYYDEPQSTDSDDEL